MNLSNPVEIYILPRFGNIFQEDKRMKKRELKKIALNTRYMIGDITYANIVRFIEFLGYSVVYDNGDKLNVAAATDFDNRSVYISSKLNEEIGTMLLLHEVAHIVLEHYSIFNDTTQQEIEAEHFVKCIMKPIVKPQAVYITLILAVLIVFGIVGLINYNETKMLPEPTESTHDMHTEQTETQEYIDTVVITPSGSKYHKPDCQYVRNKSDVITLTLDEAIKMNYEQCKVCFK